MWGKGHVQDVRDLDAELVLAVEDLESLAALWDQAVTVDQDTIDVEGKGEVGDITTANLRSRGSCLIESTRSL